MEHPTAIGQVSFRISHKDAVTREKIKFPSCLLLAEIPQMTNVIALHYFIYVINKVPSVTFDQPLWQKSLKKLISESFVD